MNDKKNTGEDLYGRMADKLRNHAEPYQEGAWERFASRNPDIVPAAAPLTGVVQGRGSGRWSSWKWSAAAAVLVLASVAVLRWGAMDHPARFGGEEPEMAVEPSFVEPSFVEPSLVEALPVEPGVEVESVAAVESLASVEPLNIELLTDVPPVIVPDSYTPEGRGQVLDPLPTPGLEEISLHLATLELELDLPGHSRDRKSARKPDDPHAWMGRPVSVATADQIERPSPEELMGDRKWDLGLILSSAMTTEQLNLGGGVSFAYHLSDRLSLRSGLSLGKYGVNTDGTRPPAGMKGSYDSPAIHPSKELHADSKPVRYTRQLSATTSSLLAMDIPVDLRYAWTNRFYTSIGMSFLGILSEDRTHHFIDRINEPVFTGEVSAGQDIAYSVRAFHVEERAAEHPLSGKGYAGFLNFSIGHRTPLSEKINLSIEPFFKLPVGRLSNEDMNLTNGGIRIVTGF